MAIEFEVPGSRAQTGEGGAMNLTNLGIRNRWSLPVIASAYMDSDEYGVVDQHNHIVIGISSQLSKEDAEYLAAVINACAGSECDAVEAKKLAKWTPITPENLPKVGWEVGRTSANDPLGPYNVRDVREVSQILVDTCCDMDSWIFYNYQVTRSINPPQPAEAEWSRQCNECGSAEFHKVASL